MFRDRILAHMRPDHTVLDVGAGAGIVAAMNFKGKCAKICGVDLDPRVVDNPMLDEGLVSDAGGIPYPDSTFDLVFADNVMEHLDDPVAVFTEINRVMKPGATLLFKTPNKTHYMPTIARMTPHSFHEYINKLRGRDESDTFPTRYRVNTVSDVGAVAARSGFQVTKVERIEGRPEYTRINGLLYLIGGIYERIVNASNALSALRILLIAELRKA